MPKERQVTLWPSRENYARFKKLCDDEIPADFEKFENNAISQLHDLARQGVFIEKIAFDPDRMAQWCNSHFGTVDSVARSAYAAFLASSD